MLLPLKKKSNFFENRKKNFMIEYLVPLLNAVCGERKESTRTKASRKFHPDPEPKIGNFVS